MIKEYSVNVSGNYQSWQLYCVTFIMAILVSSTSTAPEIKFPIIRFLLQLKHIIVHELNHHPPPHDFAQSPVLCSLSLSVVENGIPLLRGRSWLALAFLKGPNISPRDPIVSL